MAMQALAAQSETKKGPVAPVSSTVTPGYVRRSTSRSRGFGAVSMSDLREALSVPQASLYAAYGSKQALSQEAAALCQAMEGGSTAGSLAAGRTARESIEVMLREAVKTFATQVRGEAGCLIVLGVVNCSIQNHEIGDQLRDIRLQHLRLIEDRLRRGVQEADLPASTPVKAIAGFYATTLHGLSVQARDGSSARALHAVVDCAMRAWDELIRP